MRPKLQRLWLQLQLQRLRMVMMVASPWIRKVAVVILLGAQQGKEKIVKGLWQL
jgi:hypothetical protein